MILFWALAESIATHTVAKPAKNALMTKARRLLLKIRKKNCDAFKFASEQSNVLAVLPKIKLERIQTVNECTSWAKLRLQLIADST